MTDTFVKITQLDLLPENKHTLNEKLREACRVGFFYFEYPEYMNTLINEYALPLCNKFYKETYYRSLKLGDSSGYFDCENCQLESFILKEDLWTDKLRFEIASLSFGMKNMAVDILKKVLILCDIPGILWAKCTGGATLNGGQTHLTFNHYRSDKPFKGLEEHCDFGLVTVLFPQKGLQTLVNGIWTDIETLDNHFVINFGKSLERLVGDHDKLVAALHRVLHLDCDTVSFGIFLDNHENSTIYKYNNEALECTYTLYKHYIDKSFEIYYH
jgi:isopenicillin N synthase-like dioxygenase